MFWGYFAGSRRLWKSLRFILTNWGSYDCRSNRLLEPARPRFEIDHSSPRRFAGTLQIGRSRPLRLRWGAQKHSPCRLLSPAGILEVASRARSGTAWALEPASLRYGARIVYSSPPGPTGTLDHTELHESERNRTGRAYRETLSH